MHPDLARVLELLDQEDATQPMRLRPGRHEAQLMWAQEAKGEPVDLSVLTCASARGPGKEGRKVATQQP